MKSNEVVSIGITGKWGEGKTSLVNCVSSKLSEDKNTIIINFNPWLNISTNQLQKEFFHNLSNVLEKYSFSLTRDIKKYSSLLSKVDNSGFLDNIISFFRLYSNETIESEFDVLDKKIKKLNKRIVIIIDDLDRLLPAEILSVFTLIRNTANFSSFIYITCYDKDYITNALSKIDIPFPRKYSEKIFFKEYSLLPITRIQKIKTLKSLFQDKLALNDEKQLDGLADENNYFLKAKGIYSIIIDVLESYRDLVKFSSILIPLYNKFHKDVIFKEYFSIQLLKFKYYDIYLLLFKNRDEFLKTKSTSANGFKYLLIYIENPLFKDDKDRYLTKFDKSKLKQYLRDYLNYDDNDLIKIEIILSNLFYESEITLNKLSFCYNKNYYTYFNEISDDSVLKYKEFLSVYQSSEDYIFDKISNYDNLKLESFIFYLDKQLEQITNVHEIDKFFKVLFLVRNYYSEITEKYRCEFDDYLIFNVLTQETITYKILNFNKKQVFKYLDETLRNPYKNQFLYSSSFCRELILYFKYLNGHYELLIQKSFKQIDNYYLDYSKIENKRIRTEISLFYNTNRSFNSTSSLNCVFKESIKKSYKANMIDRFDDYFINTLLIHQDFYNYFKPSKSLVGFNDIVLNIFGSLEGFKDFLNSNKSEILNDSEFFNECLLFLEQIIFENTKYVNFKFNNELINSHLISVTKNNWH